VKFLTHGRNQLRRWKTVHSRCSNGQKANGNEMEKTLQNEE